MSPFAVLLGFLPPDLSPAYLLALAPAVLQTLALALGATVAAFVVSVPLGVVAALRLPGARALLAGLGAVRAIPDLTLAILSVVLFGLGPGAGLVALSIYYAAGAAKMIDEILRTAPQAPLSALRAAGASPLQVALYGLLPLKRTDVTAYAAYELECALRSSVVVGAVGGGGLGAELVGSLAAFDFHRVATQLLILTLLAALFDRAAKAARRDGRWLLLVLPLGAVAIGVEAPRLLSLAHAAQFVGRMLPPVLPADAWSALPRQLAETAGMALAGTAGAAAFALVAGPASARTLSPSWLGWPLRRALELLRAVPEIVWGLILIASVGVGPVAGAWALGIHSAGCLARLYADTLENAPPAPQAALKATGASHLAVFAYATAPLASGPMLAHTLFRLEWNLRMATVLGVIGAGGIGQALYDAQQLFFYQQMLAYVLVTWALIALIDGAGQALRRRYTRLPMLGSTLSPAW